MTYLICDGCGKIHEETDTFAMCECGRVAARMEWATPEQVASHDLLCWLRGKLTDAEQSLKSREALANPPTISEEEWERLKSLPSTIVGKPRKVSKAKQEEGRQELLRHKRIAIKCRREVEMFKATISAVESLHNETSPDAGATEMKS